MAASVLQKKSSLSQEVSLALMQAKIDALSLDLEGEFSNVEKVIKKAEAALQALVNDLQESKAQAKTKVTKASSSLLSLQQSLAVISLTSQEVLGLEKELKKEQEKTKALIHKKATLPLEFGSYQKRIEELEKQARFHNSAADSEEANHQRNREHIRSRLNHMASHVDTPRILATLSNLSSMARIYEKLGILHHFTSADITTKKMYELLGKAPSTLFTS